MATVQEQRRDRILKVLQEVHRLTKDRHVIAGLQKVCRREGVNTHLIPLLEEGGIIHREGNFTKWSTIPPNIHMAGRAMNELAIYNKKKSDERNGKVERGTAKAIAPHPKKEEPTILTPEQAVKNSEPRAIKKTTSKGCTTVSLLWGLLKVEVKH